MVTKNISCNRRRYCVVGRLQGFVGNSYIQLVTWDSNGRVILPTEETMQFKAMLKRKGDWEI
ncbi:MAG: hypothetical protein GY796_26695 [Chloroflexi bacterium]|nr:hypothetical protein [Chloroflexota bacterium]